VALAYGIMSDGTSNKYGLRLCTDSLTLSEVVLLINILKIKFDLNCTINTFTSPKGIKYFRIYFKADSKPKRIIIISPYIIPFSSYKLDKIKRFN
jgi:hypothetical protein